MAGKTYLVGGAVRDKLLGKPVTDFDYVVVGATRAELEAKYGPSIGMDFPVFLDKETGAQYAMARRERKVGVGYHGFEVDADETITLEDDLSRRDLTINAIAQDVETGQLIDPFNGIQDLQMGILRHVSHAFTEDPLRVVRLARFAARYKFQIAPETVLLATYVVNSGEMEALPYERYWLEIEKAVSDNNIAIFMQVANTVGCFDKVGFFKEVWGLQDRKALIGKFARVQPHTNDWMTIVALTARHDLAQVQAAPSKILDLHRAIWQVRDMKSLDVDGLFHLLKVTKAWGQSTFIDDVIEATRILGDARYITAIDAHELRELVVETRKVTSDKYQHLKGKEIGEAMDKERKEIIQRLVKEF